MEAFEIIWTSAFFTIFSWAILKLNFFKNLMITPVQLWLTFIFKILTGFVLFYIYSYFYSNQANADIFRFFEDSYYMTSSLHDHPKIFLNILFEYNYNNEYINEKYLYNMNNWYAPIQNVAYSDSRHFIKWNGVLRIFSFGYYHIHAIFFSFIALIGSTFLLKTIPQYAPKILIWSLLFIVPSLLIWTSGVTKDSLMWFYLGGAIYFLFKKQKNSINILLLLVFAYGLFTIKFYIFGLVFFAYLALIISKSNFFKKKAISQISITILLLICFYMLGNIFPQLDLLSILIQKQQDFFTLIEVENPNSAFQIPRIEHELFSLITNSPLAIFNALSRPHLGDINNALSLFALLENIVVLFYLVLSFVFFKQIKVSDQQMYLFWLISGILILTLTGLITPITGALVRYKLPGIIFILISSTYHLDFQKFKKRFKI